MICHKQREPGICGKLGEWLHEFLKTINQEVVADVTTSKKTQIVIDVTQDTGLETIAFHSGLHSYVPTGYTSPEDIMIPELEPVRDLGVWLSGSSEPLESEKRKPRWSSW